jgi:hypothetical protein
MTEHERPTSFSDLSEADAEAVASMAIESCDDAETVDDLDGVPLDESCEGDPAFAHPGLPGHSFRGPVSVVSGRELWSRYTFAELMRGVADGQATVIFDEGTEPKVILAVLVPATGYDAS